MVVILKQDAPKPQVDELLKWFEAVSYTHLDVYKRQ